MPSSYVAEDNGALVVADSTRGAVLRTIVSRTTGGGAGGPSWPSDHSVLFYGLEAGTCGAEVDSVAIDGGNAHALIPVQANTVVTGPAVRPDGQLLAISRTQCIQASAGTTEVNDVIFANPSTGAVLSTDNSVDATAGPQAWNSEGTELLALKAVSTVDDLSRYALHVLTVDEAGQVSHDLVLASPDPSCSYASALFSPSSGQVLADLVCGSTGSIVELNPGTGALISTLVPTKPGLVPTLGPIDASGEFLIYGLGPQNTSPAPNWYVLSHQISGPLPTAPGVAPALW